MRILVTGASGFIGAHLAAWLSTAGHEIVGSARDAARAQRRYPQYAWIQADFRQRVVWHLDGIDAVINCVGVLQDGGADSTRAAHVDGASKLFDACEQAGIRRVIQLSAIGADPAANTAYARTKHAGDQNLMARDLDWTIVKPSLVVARGVYGGTALVRGLAGLPQMTPIIASLARFRPLHIRDLCAVFELLLAPAAPTRVVIEAAGPQEASLQELIATHRRWLGFAPARCWIVPACLTRMAFAVGDMLGAIGIRTALRSTSRAQMAYDVAGDPEDLRQHLGFVARPYAQALNEEPASVQDRWHARLYFIRPAAHLLLAAFWTATGIVCLTTGREEAMALARHAGLGGYDGIVTYAGALFDIALGIASLVLVQFKRAILILMAAVTALYLAILSFTLPSLWSDPLGRLLKLIPLFALLACLVAVEEER